MRIGVLGGSFDPPHNGHTALAACAFEQLQLDRLIIAVAFRQWQKQHDASAVHRFEMAKRAFEHPAWIVSAVDLERATPTFTIDTISDLKVQYPAGEFTFIVGADAVATLANWHRSAELASQVRFAAAARAGKTSDVPAGFTVEWLDCDLPDVTSTAIRRELEVANRDLGALAEVVPPAVLTYIHAHRLYS